MKLKIFLIAKKKLIKRIECKEMQFRYYQDKAERCTANYNPVVGYNESPELQTMEYAIIEMSEIEKELTRDKQLLKVLNKEFEKCVKRLHNPKFELLLTMKYVDECTWSQMEQVLDRSRTQLHRYLKEAVKAFDALAEKEK